MIAAVAPPAVDAAYRPWRHLPSTPPAGRGATCLPAPYAVYRPLGRICLPSTPPAGRGATCLPAPYAAYRPLGRICLPAPYAVIPAWLAP